MSEQLGLGLGDAPIGGSPLRGEIGAGDPMPPGPYSVGLTYWQAGDGAEHEGPPYTVRCGDGRAIAGHVPSLACAEAIVAALNVGGR